MRTELILVDWNPPADKPPLADVLSFSAGDFFSARVIVVPPAVHDGFRHGSELPLFQMIAKNVGIRRAQGEFILATNIDILLDDALFSHIAEKGLRKDFLYRADRYDVKNAIPGGHEAQQAFCRDPGNHIRRNHRQRPPGYSAEQEKSPADSSALLANRAKFPWFELTEKEAVARADIPLRYLHTNGCGDFTLLHRDAWAALRGYGEFEAYSMHIDSIGCLAAHCFGFREVVFLPPLVSYHIEHAPASGWTPEAGDDLFARLRKKRMPVFDWEFVELVFRLSRDNDQYDPLNDETWGLRDFDFEERRFTAEGGVHVESSLPAHYYRTLTAIKPQYNYTLLCNDCRIQRVMPSRWRKIGLRLGLTTKTPYDDIGK